MQRARPGHGPRHQHLLSALVTEFAIGKAHPRNRTAESALVALVEIEAGLERQTFERSADALAANLKRVAGQTQMADRTGAGELDRAGSPHVVEDAAGT